MLQVTQTFYLILLQDGIEEEKIARRTTGAKGCNYLAGFLQVSHMFLKHLLEVCSNSLKKSLTSLQEVTNSKFMKSLSSQ